MSNAELMELERLTSLVTSLTVEVKLFRTNVERLLSIEKVSQRKIRENVNFDLYSPESGIVVFESLVNRWESAQKIIELAERNLFNFKPPYFELSNFMVGKERKKAYDDRFIFPEDKLLCMIEDYMEAVDVKVAPVRFFYNGDEVKVSIATTNPFKKIGDDCLEYTELLKFKPE